MNNALPFTPVVAFTEQKVSGVRDAIEVAPASATIVEILVRPTSRVTR